MAPPPAGAAAPPAAPAAAAAVEPMTAAPLAAGPLAAAPLAAAPASAPAAIGGTKADRSTWQRYQRRYSASEAKPSIGVSGARLAAVASGRPAAGWCARNVARQEPWGSGGGWAGEAGERCLVGELAEAAAHATVASPAAMQSTLEHAQQRRWQQGAAAAAAAAVAPGNRRGGRSGPGGAAATAAPRTPARAARGRCTPAPPARARPAPCAAGSTARRRAAPPARPAPRRARPSGSGGGRQRVTAAAAAAGAGWAWRPRRLLARAAPVSVTRAVRAAVQCGGRARRVSPALRAGALQHAQRAGGSCGDRRRSAADCTRPPIACCRRRRRSGGGSGGSARLAPCCEHQSPSLIVATGWFSRGVRGSYMQQVRQSSGSQGS